MVDPVTLPDGRLRELADDMDRFLRGADRPDQRNFPDMIARLFNWRDRLTALLASPLHVGAESEPKGWTLQQLREGDLCGVEHPDIADYINELRAALSSSRTAPTPQTVTASYVIGGWCKTVTTAEELLKAIMEGQECSPVAEVTIRQAPSRTAPEGPEKL